MRKKIFLYIIFFIFSCSFSRAAYIENIPCTLIQPSGDTIYCFVSGDEFYHYYHDQNGYTIIQNIETGYYVYAIKEGDFVVPSEHIVGKANPRILQLEPRVRKSNEEIRAIWNSRMLPAEEIRSSYRRSRAVETNHGNINNLVIFIRFLGDADLTTPFSTVDNMFNESTSGANSMYNYFKQVSYQQLYINSSYYPAPSGNTILSYEDIYARNYYLPYSSSNPSGYSTETQRRTREFALLERAINYVKSSIHSGLNIDYNQDGLVDNICFVVKGNVSAWSDLLWPHRWSLYDRTVLINGKRAFDFNFQLEGATGYFNNAVLCHEMFHTLGAPDLYHYSTDWDHLVPVGRWDIMENTANPPQHMGAYMKYVYGNWIDSIPEITRYGTYTLRSLGSGNNSGKCYKIATNDPNQFILLEYRRTTDSFESMVYGSGIVIYRIDQNYGGNADYDGSYYFDEVYVFRPGGTTTNNGNLAQSFYSSNSGRTQFNLTSNPAPFLTDGTAIGITIEDITSVGDSIQFRYGPLSSEIVTNPSSLSFQGTILNPPSIKSTTIIGNYLTDSITITIASPTSYFQISKDQLSWSNQIKIPPTGGVCYTKFNTISTGDYQDSLICSSPGASNKIIHLEATICGAVDTFPWHENFESGSIPYCWSEEYAYGTVSWDYRTGAYSGSSINSAHSGNYNAYFAFSSFSAFTTKLISPIFDLSGMINPELSFWHAQEVWNGDQDELKIYYKTQENGAWTLLQYYNSDIPVWTEHRISLPNPSSQYLIAFEGINHYGYGVVIDDISIYENLPQNITLSDSSYNFTTLINTTGDIDSTLITGHYLTDPISVTTSPPFEISLNKISWSSTVQMNSAGGTLYLRYTPTTTDSICDTMVITSDTIIRHIYVCGTPILPSFSIVATTGNNGTISPSGNVTVYYGDTLQFVPAPNVGYEVEHITIDGTIVDSLASFTFYNITANHSINVTFKKIQFNIVATAGNNGTISPSGNITVYYGDTLQFVPAPNVGYEVEHITVDGTVVDSLTSFTFYNITANHSINVTFKKIQFNIVATAGNNGTISPSGNIAVYYGDTLQFVPTPNVGYEVEHITIDGTIVDSLASFTFYNITANHSINVTFKKIQFNIVATAGNNGTISPSGNITVYYGDNLQFVPTPNVGYEVEHITVDGTVVDSLASFTFYNITTNHSINVTFKKIRFNIVATAGNNGTISPSGNITVYYGDTLQFVPAPNVGYEVEHITVDRTTVDSLASFTLYNITANHSIHVTFKKIQFNIVATAGNNGTISPSGSVTIDYGDTLQFIPSPNVGYEVEHITIDGAVVDSLTSFTLYNITANHSIHVTFKKIQFNIVATAGNNGTISPSGNITIYYGDTLQFVPAPNVGYEVEHITVDGNIVDSLASFTFYNITANHNINVTFKKIQFNIVATAGNNGTISPSGSVTVDYGDTLQFIPSPNVGYEVEHITIDGAVVDSLTSFTLYNITANHSIHVTFKKIQFNIVATAGNNGTISPSGNITIYYGDTLQFVPAPNVGYEVEHITIDGTVVDSFTSFTLYNITANHSIHVTFKKIQFNIVATTGNNGTISPSGNITVYYGDTLQFVPTPNVGNEVEHITVDGNIVDSLASFTFYNITANHNINVTFKKIQFNIVATAGNNGTISPSGNITVYYGDNLQFVPTPNVGYEVEHITVDGTTVDSLASFTFYNITANHSINVTFKKIQFNILATAGNNGTISPSGNITVYYGDTLQFVPAPNVGYEVEHITIDGTVVDSFTSFTLYNITANHSIHVTFKKIQFNIVATAGNNGTISPSGNITIYYGDTLQFVPAPNVGYEVGHITIDGTVVDSLTSFTFYNITANHSINVTFKKIQFNIVATAGNNGTISPNGSITVYYGDTLQFVPAPNVGYEVEHITIDGTVVDSLTSFTLYNITANHSINVTFKKIQFNIVATAGNNGTISPNGSVTVDYGDNLQFVPTPNVGYEVEHITVDGTIVDSLVSFTLYNITANHTINLTFKKIQFNIVATAGNNGTISPNGSVSVEYGDNLQFVPTPNVGYEVEHITVDGTVVDSLASFTFYNITTNHSINVTFKKIQFNIVATAGNNGTISPSGNITIYYGDTLQFVPAPNVGYEVEHITVDGAVVDSLTSFTLYNITANHSIHVTFKKIQFNIVATAGNNGTISPNGSVSVEYGDNLQFVPAPNVGYEVEHITVDGTIVDSLASFTFYNITTNHSINVTFKKIQFNIVATAGNNGTISPSGSVTVDYGDNLQFVPTPNVGYEVEHITVDGTVVDSLASFTFYNITTNHSINVTFKKIQFNIVATAGNNGTISPSGNITIYYGDTLQFVPAPNVGYEVEHITVDGAVVDSLTSFTLYNITANHSIHVTFKKIQFNIVATAGNNGTISPSGNITVYYGDTLQFVPAPNVGYEVEHITVDGNIVDSLASFTFYNITANHNINVTFKKIQFNIVATAGNNGTISPSGSVTVDYGDTLQFIPSPNVGYEVEHITIDGAVVDSLTSFTLYNITANHSIHVTFKKIQFNIVATAGNNGTISPSGNITIYYGDTLQFVPAPNVGYEVEHITVDGAVVDSLTSFTFYNITANHNINVTFKKIQFNILATAGNNGTISPSGSVTIDYGDTLQFIPSPNVGYEVEHITIDGAVVDSLTSFTLYNITANHSIHVTFKKIQFNIVATAGNNGTISPSGNITIYYGDTLQFVPAPNVGYEVEHITVDGAVVDSLTSFTFYNITANHNINVTFKKIQFNILATAGNNGTISPSGNITIYYGDTLQFVPTPNVGYEVEHITVDGTVVDSLASFTFYNITANHNINVTFKKIQFNIVATAGNNGTISPSGSVTIDYGDTLQFIPSPNVGYEVEHITVDGNIVDSLASFTFYNITANHNINATFKKIQFNIVATAGNNGTISPSGSVTVDYGDTLQFIPSPNVGYEVEHITVDGNIVDSLASFTFYNITANHNINVTFKKIQFNILATAGNNGTISPSGNITIYYGDTLQFVPTPNVGYEVEHITVDGTIVDSLASFTFFNIIDNHSIHVTFKSSSSTSIISNEQSLPYLIYPNPATQKITFECERHAELDRISIYSASGQLLFSTLIQDQKTVINIQNWTNGIYFIQVHLKNKTIEYESIIKL